MMKPACKYLNLLASLPLLFLNSAYSAETARIDSDQPRPVVELEQELSKKPPLRRVRILKKAYEALQNEEYATAIQLAGSGGQGDFPDYGAWISAAANRGEAQENIEKKAFPEALKS